jgi:hypothetical protein
MRPRPESRTRRPREEEGRRGDERRTDGAATGGGGRRGHGSRTDGAATGGGRESTAWPREEQREEHGGGGGGTENFGSTSIASVRAGEEEIFAKSGRRRRGEGARVYIVGGL